MANDNRSVMGYPLPGPSGIHIPKRVQAIQNLARWKQAGGWLAWEIGTGMQKLIALALDGHPAAEMLEITAEIWFDALPENLIEEIDRPRVQLGFRKLIRESQKWPQPADLIKAMPPRPERIKLAAPEPSEETRAAGRERLKAMMEKFK